MGKVIFSIKYEIRPERKNEYLTVMKELKNLIKAEGLSDYKVFEHRSKKNTYEEIYFFDSEDAFENWDDVQSERVELLMKKLSDTIKEQTTEYSRLYEID